VTGERKDDNGMGAGTGDEPETAADREKPLNGRNPAWQRDATSPQIRTVEQTVEGLRKPEDGT